MLMIVFGFVFGLVWGSQWNKWQRKWRSFSVSFYSTFLYTPAISSPSTILVLVHIYISKYSVKAHSKSGWGLCLHANLYPSQEPAHCRLLPYCGHWCHVNSTSKSACCDSVLVKASMAPLIAVLVVVGLEWMSNLFQSPRTSMLLSIIYICLESNEHHFCDTNAPLTCQIFVFSYALASIREMNKSQMEIEYTEAWAHIGGWGEMDSMGENRLVTTPQSTRGSFKDPVSTLYFVTLLSWKV